MSDTSKDTSQNQDELIAFVKDPKNIKKAIEGSMDKRIAVQASADVELEQILNNLFSRGWDVALDNSIRAQQEQEKAVYGAKELLIVWRDKTRPLPSLPMINDAWCIACGNETLFLGDGGLITCSWMSCPDPSASYEAIKSMDVKSGDHGQDQGTDLAIPGPDANTDLSNPPKRSAKDIDVPTKTPAATSSREGELTKEGLRNNFTAAQLGSEIGLQQILCQSAGLSVDDSRAVAYEIANWIAPWHTQQVEAAIYQAQIAMLNALKNVKFDNLEQVSNWLSVMADTLPAPQKDKQ